MSDEKKVLEFKKKAKWMLELEKEELREKEIARLKRLGEWEEPQEESFEDQVKRNLADKKRMKEEREKENEMVKKLYRLKNKDKKR